MGLGGAGRGWARLGGAGSGGRVCCIQGVVRSVSHFYFPCMEKFSNTKHYIPISFLFFLPYISFNNLNDLTSRLPGVS